MRSFLVSVGLVEKDGEPAGKNLGGVVAVEEEGGHCSQPARVDWVEVGMIAAAEADMIAGMGQSRATSEAVGMFALQIIVSPEGRYISSGNEYQEGVDCRLMEEL